jgi:integrase
MRRYYLHQRKGIFYAVIVTPQGNKLTAKSTGKTTEDEALLVVSKWLSEGIPKRGKEKPVETLIGLSEILKAIKKTDLDGNDAMKIVESLKKRELIDVNVVKAGNGAVLFTEYLDQFWDYCSSPYVKAKKADNESIGRRHCYEMASRVHSYYFDYFKDRPLNSITKRDMTEFKLYLSEPRKKPENYKGKFAEKLSASYKNKILTAGLTALKFAHNEGLIAVNPAENFKMAKGSCEKKRVLSPLEAEAVFKTNWKDKRSYIGNLLSITTGLRAGEVLALRKSDIGDRVLFIRHSWSTMDGLKAPKNGDERKVPLLPEVKEKIMELLNQNPHKVDDPFIFYGLLEDKPMDQKILLDGLKMACRAAGVEPVVFHAHRHFYAARLADRMTADQVSRITGHKSRAVFDTYADHLIDANIEAMAEATAATFGKILQFPKAI